jgi:hypothetical protein
VFLTAMLTPAAVAFVDICIYLLISRLCGSTLLTDNCLLPLSFGSFVILTWPTQSTAHKHDGVAAGNDKR